MPLAQTIIDAALIDELGIYEPGETPSSNDRNLGLRQLNRMVQQWNLQRRFSYVVNHVAYTLTASQASYSIGPSGGNFTMAGVRPLRIERANLIRVADTPDTRIQLHVRN